MSSSANTSLLDFEFPYPSQRMPALGRNAVASSHALATQAALDVLQRGGNAIDAALAGAAVLTVVEPTMNGIGGDLFALVWDGKELHGLNASGRAPHAWNKERFSGRKRMPSLGWDSVTVPGGVSGWVALSERFASRSLEETFATAIGYARDGYAVTPRVAALWAEAPERFGKFAEFSRVFLPNDRAPAAGSWMTFPDAAETLSEIAASRGASFYAGRLARAIADAAKADGGALTLDDLGAHRADWVKPLSVEYAGVRLHELPPNGQGLASLLALSILAELDLGRHPPDGADSVHLQVEAMKLAFAQCERHVADPDSMRVTVEELLDPKTVQKLAALIRMDRAADVDRLPPADHGTVYIATGDAGGRMVSLIQSNYLGFGSGVVVPNTGISLQNRGLGFRLEPDHPSCVAGGKRPYHTIMPGFVTVNGDAAMSFGVIGGHMQPQGHVQLVVRNFLYGQNPQTACDAPRWYVSEERELGLEPAIEPTVGVELARRGHRLLSSPSTRLFGGAQAVRRMARGYCAASDPRKDGQAAAA
ncbi:MAG TPA: gamma-glutamyltransferase family protein [Polyangiaceae bacterium]|jgi:gamma-glutamyltranspeptidase/glutathione hydrolase|nr:gamma-glutamyltransferase family protein [Polyangiaceae bacterium]